MGYLSNADILAGLMSKSIFSRQQEQLQAVLRRARREAGLTQTELAKRLKQPQSFVSKYESGERLLDLVEVRQICRVVQIPLAEVIRQWEEGLQ